MMNSGTVTKKPAMKLRRSHCITWSSVDGRRSIVRRYAAERGLRIATRR